MFSKNIEVFSENIEVFLKNIRVNKKKVICKRWISVIRMIVSSPVGALFQKR